MIDMLIRVFALLLIVVFVTACGDDDDDDNNDDMDPGNGFELPEGLVDATVLMEFTTANAGAPYALNDQVEFSFSASGEMGIDTDPDADNGDEITLSDPSEVGNEIVWEDQDAGYNYALSLLVDGSINEINVSSMSDNSFLGQFTVLEEGSIATTIGLFAGTYNVTSADLGAHTRNTVVIDADGNIDFDEDKQANAADIADSNDVVLIDGNREIIARYTPYPTEPYVEVIIDINDSGVIIAIEYRVDEVGPSLDRTKVLVTPG